MIGGQTTAVQRPAGEGRSLPSTLPPNVTVAAALMIAILVATPICHGDKINALMVGSVWGNTLLEKYFDEEPLMEYSTVPCRDGAGFAMKDLIKAVKLYFPRTYEDMKEFDYLMLLAPEFYLMTPIQDRWMHDLIEDGAGGFNDGSVFSIVGQIHGAWAISLTQQAFPNDAPAVVARGSGGESPSSVYAVEINRDFPDPVLTPFIEYGVEDFGKPARLDGVDYMGIVHFLSTVQVEESFDLRLCGFIRDSDLVNDPQCAVFNGEAYLPYLLEMGFHIL